MAIRLFLRDAMISKVPYSLPTAPMNKINFTLATSGSTAFADNSTSKHKRVVQVLIFDDGSLSRSNHIELSNWIDSKGKVEKFFKETMQQISNSDGLYMDKSEANSAKMNFEEFLKSDYVMSFDEYKEAPNSSILFGNDEEQLKTEYEKYCKAIYSDYKNSNEKNDFFTAH